MFSLERETNPKVKNVKQERQTTNIQRKQKEDLRKVARSNFKLIKRKMSGNIARKIWWYSNFGDSRDTNKNIFTDLL